MKKKLEKILRKKLFKKFVEKKLSFQNKHCAKHF